MKAQQKQIFTLTEERTLIGFETETVYKVCHANTTTKICNVFEDKSGVIRIGSIFNMEIELLDKVIQFIKTKFD